VSQRLGGPLFLPFPFLPGRPLLLQSASTEANAVATVVESLGQGRPEVGFFLRSVCRRRKTKDAHDEGHAQLHP
jgi:hypothetical protein